jgi:hypothetical protein
VIFLDWSGVLLCSALRRRRRRRRRRRSDIVRLQWNIIMFCTKKK